jgi:hypothetical protein
VLCENGESDGCWRRRSAHRFDDLLVYLSPMSAPERAPKTRLKVLIWESPSIVAVSRLGSVLGGCLQTSNANGTGR